MTEPNLGHLIEMTTPLGLYEHARGLEPRVEEGFCVDDVARALVVVARQPHDPQRPDRPSSDQRRALANLTAGYLAFVVGAEDCDGRFRNRRTAQGRWHGPTTVEDHWGRALWGLGVAASHLDGNRRVLAIDSLRRGLRRRSPWLRATAYAALGAAELLRVLPDDEVAHSALRDAGRVLRMPAGKPWPWPEPRLTYANPVLPEALIAIGAACDDQAMIEEGLETLRWLLDLQVMDDHLSLVPVGGWQPGETIPGFDQQPIEAAALAEAAWRAFEVSGDQRWLWAIDLAHRWFLGDNDAGLQVCDLESGGAMDGLHRTAVNLNQGAESTLAWLETQQVHARAAQARIATTSRR